MRNLIGSLLVVLAFGWSGLASAEVFRCVDEATGSVTFSDKDCPDKTAGEYIPVGNTNGDGGYDETAAMKLERKYKQEAEEHQRAWRQHNAQATIDEQNRKAAIERERRTDGVSFEGSMSSKQYKKSADGHSYRDYSRK